MMKFLKKYIVIFILLTVVIAAFVFISNDKSEDNKSDKIQISTSFYPLYYFAKEIGGGKAEVLNITPAGAEPHEYEPSAREIARIHDSQMLIVNGNFEPWADEIIDELDTTVIVVKINENSENKDPHIWLDPVQAKDIVRKILEAYEKIDHKNSGYYENNAKTLELKLDELNLKFKNGLQSCKKKDIVTSHNAFDHLAKRYNLNQVAISGISPDEEPSSQKLGQISNFVKANNISYIFFETLVNKEFSETIASESGAQTLVLDPLEGISDENIENGKNYFSIMENNLNNLRIALECGQ